MREVLFSNMRPGTVLVTLYPLHSRRSMPGVVMHKCARDRGSACDPYSNANLYFYVAGAQSGTFTPEVSFKLFLLSERAMLV